MKKIATLLFFLLPAAFAQQWSIGYWSPYGNPGCPISEIEMGGLTHIVHWAALVNANGTLDLDTQRIAIDGQGLVAAAHANGVKAVLGIVNPYWIGQTANLPQAAAGSRATLVNSIMSVVENYGYDGVDIDWEPFDGGSVGLMQALASELKSRLGSRTLTAAAIVTDYRIWGSMQGPFDRVNMMTYDLTGTWNAYSWHNAALYDPDGQVWSINLAVQRFTANGVPASKLGIGIPFFGYQWSGGGVSAPLQRWSSTPRVQQINYQNFASQISTQTYAWDAAARTPYLSGANSFLTYDDARSIAEKISYARSNNLGGWIIWNIGIDYLPSQSPKHPLMKAVKDAMGGVSPAPISTPAPAPSAPGPAPSAPAPAPSAPTPVVPAPMPPPATPDVPLITMATMPDAQFGVSYSSQVLAGLGGSTLLVTAGRLPSGLSLDGVTGVVGGTAMERGTFQFEVSIQNASTSYKWKVFGITVTDPGI